MKEENGVAWWIENGLGRVELRRSEKANALDVQTSRALAKAIHDILDSNPKVIMLTSAGRIFCAGGDIQEFCSAGDKLDHVVDNILESLNPAIARLAKSETVVISVVSGALGGAGIGLALCSDFVLASTEIKLRTGYASIGLSPDAGSSYFLARRIGGQKAKQWFLLNESMDARTCLHNGAVDALHAPEELMSQAELLAKKLLSGSRGAHAAIKRLCDSAATNPLNDHLVLEHGLIRHQAMNADAREGINSYLSKRSADFKS